MKFEILFPKFTVKKQQRFIILKMLAISQQRFMIWGEKVAIMQKKKGRLTFMAVVKRLNFCEIRDFKTKWKSKSELLAKVFKRYYNKKFLFFIKTFFLNWKKLYKICNWIF